MASSSTRTARIELRVNGEGLTTGAPMRDRAWHFVAATFDAETGRAVLYHEPQVRYALDPVVEPVGGDARARRSSIGPVPLVIAGYVEAPRLADRSGARRRCPA